MVYGRLMKVFFLRFYLEEATCRRPWDISAHWENVFLMFGDYRTSFLWTGFSIKTLFINVTLFQKTIKGNLKV